MSEPLPSSDLNLDREQRFSSAFQQLMGYRLVEWAPDYAVVAYDVMPDHLNRTNRLHGGVIASLLDTAAGYAGCFCATPGETRTTVTLSLTVNFLASASSGSLRISARRTGGGKTIFFSEATALDAENRTVATAVGTFRYVSATPVGSPQSQ
ncbi:MAG: hypothetical protein AVDCRST_MAG91-2819 [uncultured Sphingomonadaceae bacterium]|uniref:Thioesterase domain-containing protein n=1 Tax=uncultured Sphingomonadaceae bacterium TaxID=169976 RepID=A0A6J4TQI8_9SPHN|nr:MAG: hypothetical protein AVDCRST_MAG91-2819 [uncultured Sphingomonadaceae bacterium]